MAASSSSSMGRISILKSCIESSSIFYQNRNLKFNQKQKQMKRIFACSDSSIDHHNNNTRAVVSTTSSSSTTNAYSDTVFGTELKKNKKKQQQQHRQDNASTAAVREIKVGVKGKEEEVSPRISADKLDEWMAFSVPEIVKNIGDAPLLVHIYSSMSKGLSSIGSSSSSSSPVAANPIPIPIIEKSKADAESWSGVTKRWEEGSRIPDGIILVEELKDGGASDMSTKTWGLVIQGRGVESASSCYILKTCRVGSSSLGFCTHFCLARAKCFGESADLQLKNSWLLGH